MRALGWSSSNCRACTGPRTVPLMMTWSACTSPHTTAASEITRMLGCSALALMLPKHSPSTRKPSVNLRLPSIRLPCAIRLLMGGGAFLPNMGFLFCFALQFDALYRADHRSLHHFGGNVFHHGLRRQVDHSFDAPVLLEGERLWPAGQVHHPRLAPDRAGQPHLELAAE